MSNEHEYFIRAKELLIDGVCSHNVQMCLSDVIHNVEINEHSESVTLLSKNVHDANVELVEQKQHVKAMHDDLECQTRDLTARRHEINQESEQLRVELEELTNRIGEMREKEREHAERMRSLNAQSDITLLDSVALRVLVGFFTVSDFVMCRAVCRRWQHAFGRGYLWKALHNRMEREFLMAKRNYLENLIPVHGHVHLKLDPKGDLTKQEMFDMCNDRALQRFIGIQSEREDLSSKERADREVRDYLVNQLGDLQHQVGIARVEEGSWHDQIQNKRAAKNALLSALSEREDVLAKAREQHTKMLCDLDAQRKDVETKVTMASELRALQPNGHGNTGDDNGNGDARVVELVSELKAQKKVLVKHLKMLRSEVAQAESIKHTYAHKLQKLDN